MSLDSQKKGQLGVNVVERIVLQMGWRWQQLDAVNDDGVDGLIFIESGGMPTGQIVYAQVKCHASRINREGQICVAFEKKGLSRNYEKWRRVVGAAILVHVNPSPPFQAHWVNLLEDGVIKGSQVFVESNSSFSESSRRTIARLCGNIHRDLLKVRVETNSNDFEYIKDNSKELQSGAKKFYKELSHLSPRLGKSGPVVSFTSEGWRHITRKSRPRLTQLQTFLLLGCVPHVLQVNDERALEVGNAFEDGSRQVYARAAVTFPFRQTCIIKLILRRRGSAGTYRYSFWSLYEVRRARDVLGRK